MWAIASLFLFQTFQRKHCLGDIRFNSPSTKKYTIFCTWPYSYRSQLASFQIDSFSLDAYILRHRFRIVSPSDQIPKKFINNDHLCSILTVNFFTFSVCQHDVPYRDSILKMAHDHDMDENRMADMACSYKLSYPHTHTHRNKQTNKQTRVPFILQWTLSKCLNGWLRYMLLSTANVYSHSTWNGKNQLGIPVSTVVCSEKLFCD